MPRRFLADFAGIQLARLPAGPLIIEKRYMGSIGRLTRPGFQSSGRRRNRGGATSIRGELCGIAYLRLGVGCRTKRISAELEVRTQSPPAERCYGAGDDEMAPSSLPKLMERLMPQPNDLSRSLVALDQNSTIIAVVEMSQSSWLVGGILLCIER